MLFFIKFTIISNYFQELREEPQVKRRRKNKLIIDKTIKFSSQYMASRLQNINVELRCEVNDSSIVGI